MYINFFSLCFVRRIELHPPDFVVETIGIQNILQYPIWLINNALCQA